MKVVYIWSDQDFEYNSSWWRCRLPYRALRTTGHDVEYFHENAWNAHQPEVDKACEAADLIFFQRNSFGPALASILYWRARGKLIALDLDDGYRQMTHDTGSPSTMFWMDGIFHAGDKQMKMTPPPITQLDWGVRLCGIITSPSKLIAADWYYLANTHWIPNYIDSRLYKQFPVYKAPGSIYIGWGGSMTHMRSWRDSGINEALWAIIKEFKNVTVVLAGDQRLARDVVKLPENRKVFLGYGSIALWPRKLSYFDIGVAPLFEEYDRRRSFIKGLEYTCMGIPWVGSAMEPNVGLGTGVIVPNTKEDWYSALKDMILHINDYKAVARTQIPAATCWDAFDRAPELWGRLEKVVEQGAMP